MFRIHIARNRQPMGEFTPEEVAEGLHTGKFLPTDLGWREPMPAWKPLSEFDSLPDVQVTPPPLIEGETAVVAAPVITNTESTEPQPAWERRKALGVIPALYETVRQVFSTPNTTFQSMSKTGGLKGPLFFYMIIATLAMWASIAYQAAYFQMNPEAISQLPKTVTHSMLVTSQIFMAIMAPAFVALTAFVMSGIFHFMLNALGLAQGSFEATFRAFCYAVGVASVLQFIPICGIYLVLAAQVVLLTLAFREVHRITTWQACLGVTIPMVLCCGLFIAGYVAAIGVAFGAGALK